ncbi:hypothetical protein F511_39352 [Dorcoceras hygrometricum]|uniref:Triacylglycerol lipase n=1 Tax=Dorcoceras hygrometricum TaxID=472368 RepID=A0A2Z7D532_9LAMI|nr:hypothetical protein F511_39352 [Dorcoceras hygrometricum]
MQRDILLNSLITIRGPRLLSGTSSSLTSTSPGRHLIKSQGPSAIIALWFSDTTDQLVTTPMIAMYLSGMTHLSAGHNVSLSQVLNRSKAQYVCMNGMKLKSDFNMHITRITDSACKNQLVMVSVQYGPFNTYIPIRSTTIGKSRVARDPITMHTSWRSNSDITSVTRVSMMFRVVRTNQYNQDLGLIHSTNGNHLESPNEVSSIDHEVTIHLHAQNITMFPTNETWYFTSQMLVSSSDGLILILTVQSTRNEFIMHSDH